MSGDGSGPVTRTRNAVLAEVVCLSGLALLSMFWIIPSQVSGGGFGLDPGFLPRVYAGAIAVLVLADGLLRLARNQWPSRYAAGWSALARIGGLAIVGTIVLQFAGGAIAALVVVPLGMLVLGERRPILIAATTIIVAGTLKLLNA